MLKKSSVFLGLLFLFFASGCSKLNFGQGSSSEYKDYKLIEDSQIIGQYSVDGGNDNASGQSEYTIYKAKDPYIINTVLGQVIVLDLIHSLDSTVTYLTGDKQGEVNYRNQIFENQIKIYVDKWNSCESSKASSEWRYGVLSNLEDCGFDYDYFGGEGSRGVKDPSMGVKGVQLILDYVNSNIMPLKDHFYSDSDFEEMFLNQN